MEMLALAGGQVLALLAAAVRQKHWQCAGQQQRRTRHGGVPGEFLHLIGCFRLEAS